MATPGIRHRSLLRSHRGFSLIEVLIALSIMMGAFTVIGMAWSTSQLRLKKMKLNHQVAFLLDYKVADVERQYKDQMTLLPEEEEGTFEALGDDFEDFSWRLKSKKFELPDLTPILINQQGSADANLTMMMDKLSEYFREAAKEVTVTVVYTYKKKNVEYSATTFLVDYNQQLPIPNLGGALGGAGGTGAPTGGDNGSGGDGDE